jgi:hypothetical protein
MRLSIWLSLTAMLVLFAVVSACDDDDDDDNAQGDDDSVTDDDDDDDDDDNDNDDNNDDETPGEWPGPPWFGCTDSDICPEATVVTAFDRVDHYYNGGEDDRRMLDAEVQFPDPFAWYKVTMRVELECPADGDCDNWDRFANVALILNPGTPEEEILELWRYITPYNIGMCMHADITPFAPLLTGMQTVRSFVDTWVGPDFQSQHGHGWRVTVKFIFHPDKAGTTPDQIVNLWPYADVEVGNPDNPISGQIGDQTVALPATISRAELRLLVTGHGQGNKDNCAEFCHLDQVVLVNGIAYSFDPWRDDCDENPIGPDQDGTWTYSRAGWCPGAAVLPQTFDVLDDVIAGADNFLTYQVWESESVLYENTCRPGAGDENNYCEGCAFDNDPGNCDYNGGMHTQPNDRIAVQLFLWY